MLCARPVDAADEWLQWRGEHRDGTVSGNPWPADFSGLKEKWRVPLGQSYSGPLITKKLVITTESRERQFEAVRAYDRETGKEVWRTEWEGHQGVPFFAWRNGDWMRSTPVCDGPNLYVAGMRDVLVCLETATGKEKWRVDFVKEFKSDPPAFGFVCSPLLDGDALYVQAGGAFCRLEKESGKVVWKTLEDGGGMYGSAFSSPFIASPGGKRQILVQTRTDLCGVNPADGAVLWMQKIEAFRGMNIFTPVVAGDRIFTSAYKGVSQAWDLIPSGGAMAPKLAWEHKSEGYMSTPLLISGNIYMLHRNQRFLCLDLAKGEQRWVSEQKFGEYWSLISREDRILSLDQKGVIRLVRATPEKFDLQAERKISEDETWAHIAAVDGHLAVRELKALVFWDWK